MSMYSELLVLSLQDRDASLPTSPDDTLAALRACRRDLDRSDGRASPADRMAGELAYDRLLLALCAMKGVDHDPSRFTVPERERRRLESALGALGIDLG
jgi:hypothetical protein